MHAKAGVKRHKHAVPGTTSSRAEAGRCVPTPVLLAKVTHGEQKDEPACSHDKLTPCKVGRPSAAKQICQLLLNGIVARKADGRELEGWRVVRIGATVVAKDELHLRHKKAKDISQCNSAGYGSMPAVIERIKLHHPSTHTQTHGPIANL